jgi:hypothetical protein
MAKARKRSKNGAGTRRVVASLPRPGDPLVTEDGQVLEPEGYKQTAAERYKIKPREYRATRKRTLRELPADAGTLNGVACVLLYTLLGVPDREIATALNISLTNVGTIKRHAAYGQCFEIICNEFVNMNSDLITSRLAAYSHTALDGVYDIATAGKKENNRLKANIDILNRGGFTAKEQSTKAAMGKHELRITVLEGETHVDVSHTIGGPNGQ